jgi:hypothetical protein
MKYLVILIALVMMGCPALTSNEVYYNVKVKSKESVNRRDSHYYLIFGDKDVFMVDDSISRLVFNSSDIYNYIDIGKCYNFTTYGYREPIMSQYERIVDVKEVQCKDK